MIRHFALAAAILFGVAAPAAAFQCPADMADIGAALETADPGTEDRARVEQLRAQGEDLHAAGDHRASVDALAEAKLILGIK